jgi:hypothetical protein
VPTDEPPLHPSGYPVEPPLGAQRALDTVVMHGDGSGTFGGPYRLERWDGREWLLLGVTHSLEERDAFVLAGPYWPPPPRSMRRGSGVRYTAE